ncbi:hypothetical protein B9H02_08920 [Prosthecochloris sp. HL-130-GSB]|nr:hypothetical protein B9H02_08920 [Prosthecochloris sp. HL-130-GSB]
MAPVLVTVTIPPSPPDPPLPPNVTAPVVVPLLPPPPPILCATMPLEKTPLVCTLPEFCTSTREPFPPFPLLPPKDTRPVVLPLLPPPPPILCAMIPSENIPSVERIPLLSTETSSASPPALPEELNVTNPVVVPALPPPPPIDWAIMPLEISPLVAMLPALLMLTSAA